MTQEYKVTNKILLDLEEQNPAKSRKKQKYNRPHLLWGIVLPAVVLFSLGFFITYLNLPPELRYQNDWKIHKNIEAPFLPNGDYKEGFYTFLVVGTDESGLHTDTILVVSLDTVGEQANIVSIPRDTQVDVPRNPKKINAAYAVGGMEQLKKEIKSIIGFSPYYHLVVNLEAFEKIVNAVGGVEFEVPRDMDKDAPSQGLHIHLKKGIQNLDGDKALQLVRFREYATADIGRIETQQEFLKALANKVLTVSNIPKVPEFVEIFQEHVESNLSFWDMQWFARKVMQLDPGEDISTQILPYSSFGDYQGNNYVYLDTEKVISIINQTINPFKFDITVEDVNVIRLED